MSRKYLLHPVVVSLPEKHDCKVLASERVMLDGRVVSQSVFVTEDLNKEFEHLTSDDFRLENQLASGVELKECNQLSYDKLSLSDSIVAGVLTLNSKLNNVKSKSNPKSSNNENNVSSVSQRSSD